MKTNAIAFENVRVEMARNNLTICDISKNIGMNRETLSRKLSRKSPISLDEAFTIQRLCFPNVEVKTLFAECAEPPA